MFKVVCLICSVLCGFSFFSCTSSAAVTKNAPEWVLAPDNVYSSSDYLNAVGSGVDRRTAENDALSMLVKSIVQNVSSVSDSSKIISGNDKKGYEIAYDFTSSIATVSSVKDIVGVSYKEVWESKDGTFYVLAQINREESGRYYRQEIDARNKVINSEIVFADSNDGTFEALAALQNATNLAQENQVDMALLAGIHPDMYRLTSIDYVSPAALAVMSSRQTEKIKVSVYVEGDSQDRISGALEATLAEVGLRIAEVDEEARYSLNGKVIMEKMDGNTKYEYIRYVLNVELLDNVTQKVLVPYTENGREAHISQSEAKQRAYRTVEDSVKTKFKPIILQFFEDLR